MRRLQKLLLWCICLAGVAFANVAIAADDPAPAKKPAPTPTWVVERDKACVSCHDQSEDKPILTMYQTRHGVYAGSRTPGCQDCHGQSEDHVKNPKGLSKRPPLDVVFKKGVYPVADERVRSDKCLTCHKGTARTRWDGSTHPNNQVACNDCHKVHLPKDPILVKKTQSAVCFTCHKEQRAASLKISTHPIQEGKVVCADCHNPHGSSGPSMVKRNTVNETCWQCHAEKRGPFLFEHRPVVESCTNCHAPHGSNISPMMISRSPFMCQSCHDGSHASGSPIGFAVAGNQGGFVGNPSPNTTGRGCIDCHSQIHGSNSPNGGYLQR